MTDQHPFSVEVAPLRTSCEDVLFNGPQWLSDPLGPALPWSGRPHAILPDVHGDTTLREVLDRAVLDFDLELRMPWRRWAEKWNHWVTPEGILMADPDGAPVSISPLLTTDGRLTWTSSFDSVTFGQVRDTVDRKFLDGDPRRLFLPITGPTAWGGNGLDTVLQLVRAHQEISILIGAFGGVPGIFAAARSLQKYWRKWAPVGGDARTLLDVAKARRTEVEVAHLLEMDPRDVPTLLSFLGMTKTGKDTWKPGQAPSHELLRELAEVLGRASHRNLPPGTLGAAIREIMSLPAGTRAAQADAILADHQIRAAGSHTEEVSLWADNGDPSRVIVTRWELGESIEVGALVEMLPSVVVVHDTSGHPLLDPSGQRKTFQTFDEAAAWLQNQVTRPGHSGEH